MRTDWSLELRQSLRRLLRTRGFTLPAVIGLALGIGATTAVFSVVHAMLLKPMGFVEPDRLVTLWGSDPKRGQHQVEVSLADWIEWRKQSRILADVALASSVNLDFPLAGDGPPQQVDGTTVTGNFFQLLGVQPAAGRLFREEDDRRGAPLRLVISHRLWRSRFGGDLAVIGRQIRAGDDSATVIGVAPAEFDFPRDVDMWVPLRASWPDVEQQAQLRVFRSVARLQPGVSTQQVQAQMDVVARNVEKSLPAGATGFGVAVTPLLDEVFGAARPAVWILFGAVFLVLVIACANVANLLLARATVRGRELAIRAVLGAERGRLVKMLLVENVVLAMLAGLAGMGAAAAGVKVLAGLAPPDVPRMDQAAMDLPILAFGVILSFATVLLFGLAPAWLGSRQDPNDAMKQGGRGNSADGAQTRLRQMLIVGEVALSVVLLVGAGLLVRSFQAMASLDPGFQPKGVVTFRITTNGGTQETRRALYTRVLERMRMLPGVESAGAVLIRPLSGLVGWDTVYEVEGQPPALQAANPNGNYEAISPDYFRTMGIRLVSGRDFTIEDHHQAPGVVIINESTARRHWPGQNPVGSHLRLGRGPNSPWLTVVGVVHDVRYREWEAVRPDFYIPYLQRAQHRSDFVVKTKGDPAALAAVIRREVFEIDKNQPVSNVTTMEALVDRALARSRFNGVVLTSLAVCALVLAAIGIYSVLAYSVARRYSEIGVRMAVGATPREILALITSGGLRLTALGVLAGVVLSAMLSRVVSSLLFGVPAGDPVAYLAAVLALFAVALVACVVPARRAARVDPLVALRSE